MKTPFLILFCLLSFTASLWGQNYEAFWTGHFSYLNINKVVDADDKFYAASENALFSYDLQTNQLSTITTINGLSGELISTLHYSNEYQLLLIGYENGLIEDGCESVCNENCHLFKLISAFSCCSFASNICPVCVWSEAPGHILMLVVRHVKLLS